MKLRSKRGSYIAEAAVVLPMVILVTVTAVLIIMFFYLQMTEQCRLHLALRSEAGLLTGRTIYVARTELAEGTDAEIYTDRKPMGGLVYGKKYLVMAHKGLLERKGTFIVEDSWHAVDGTAYVRYCNMVRGAADGQDQ